MTFFFRQTCGVRDLNLWPIGQEYKFYPFELCSCWQLIMTCLVKRKFSNILNKENETILLTFKSLFYRVKEIFLIYCWKMCSEILIGNMHSTYKRTGSWDSWRELLHNVQRGLLLELYKRLETKLIGLKSSNFNSWEFRYEHSNVSLMQELMKPFSK